MFNILLIFIIDLIVFMTDSGIMFLLYGFFIDSISFDFKNKL